METFQFGSVSLPRQDSEFAFRFDPTFETTYYTYLYYTTSKACVNITVTISETFDNVGMIVVKMVWTRPPQ